MSTQSTDNNGTMQKMAKAPKADFSGVSGGVSSSADSAKATQYTVQKGDTLSAIAKQHYGNANRWRAIFDANRDVLSDPDKIQIGQVLKIPADAG